MGAPRRSLPAICSLPPAPLHSEEMTIDEKLICDGCGQAASAEHLAARLRRLEWATRWRPLHIQTLLLGAVAPGEDAEFIYSDAGEFSGEAAWVLGVAGVSGVGKPADAVHHERQSAAWCVATRAAAAGASAWAGRVLVWPAAGGCSAGPGSAGVPAAASSRA